MDHLHRFASKKDTELELITTQIEEGLAVRFTEDELQQAGKEFENALVVKIIGNRGYNRSAFKTVLRELWNPTEGLKFTEVEGNIQIAIFNNASDRDKVLAKGPWRFMGWALQVEKWVPGKQIAELFTDKLHLWIQIHNLPVEYRHNQFAIRFAEKAGRVIQVSGTKEGSDIRDDIRKFIKFKIEIDLHKPIVPGWTLDRETDTPVWITFKYERLPNVCFNCRRFDHETRLCFHASSGQSNTILGTKFGPCLRAEHNAVASIMNRKRSPSPEFGCKSDTTARMDHSPEFGNLTGRACSEQDGDNEFTAFSESTPVIPVPIDATSNITGLGVTVTPEVAVTVTPAIVDEPNIMTALTSKVFGPPVPQTNIGLLNKIDSLKYGPNSINCSLQEQSSPLETLHQFKRGKAVKRKLESADCLNRHNKKLHTSTTETMSILPIDLEEILVETVMPISSQLDLSATAALQPRRQQ